jgi:dihydrofolate reductase
MPKPVFIAFAAMTLDARIARSSDESSDWTSAEDKEFFRSKVKEFDPEAVIVGRVTYEVSREALAKYNCIVLTRSMPLVPVPAMYDNPFGSPRRVFFVNPQQVDLRGHLNDSGYQRVAVFGGAQVYSFCLAQNFLDELYLTVEPVVFGEGPVLFGFSASGEFALKSIKPLNELGTTLLHYERRRKK